MADIKFSKKIVFQSYEETEANDLYNNFVDGIITIERNEMSNGLNQNYISAKWRVPFRDFTVREFCIMNSANFLQEVTMREYNAGGESRLPSVQYDLNWEYNEDIIHWRNHETNTYVRDLYFGEMQVLTSLIALFNVEFKKTVKCPWNRK